MPRAFPACGTKGLFPVKVKPAYKKDFSKGDIAIFFSYFRPYKGAFALDMGLSVLVAAIDLVFPYVSRESMRTYLPEKMFTAFFTVMGVMLVAYLLKALFNYLVIVIGHGMGTNVEADMRTDVFTHMQQLSFSYYDKNRTGMLMARITNDLFEIVELAHHGPENVLTCGLTLVGAVVILMTINWKLALVLMVLLPLCIAFVLLCRKGMQHSSIEVKRKTGEINAAIESNISGIRTAKAFANEQAEQEKFQASNSKFVGAKKGYYRWMGIFNGGMEAMIGFIQVVVIAAGGLMIMHGEMDYVDLITFMLYISTFTTPVRKLTQFMELFTQGTAGFSRFLEVMRTEPIVKDAPDAVELGIPEGHVRYEDVSFAYDDGTQVLSHVNIDVAPGRTFALVGPSGSGKTTVCHLLPRFYDVTGGRITVDGHDIRSLTQESLRRSIGIIQQDVFLFAGTVMDNIRYGRPDATDEEVMEAARLAEIHDDILAMPQGYQSFVGERGVVLSGGQKQRISIARVFLKNPPILILDEATSALDSVTEQRIQAGLDRLAEGKTCIIIAHRLSTVRNADCIAVVEDMGISEQGTRDELLKKDGAYAALERAQALS